MSLTVRNLSRPGIYAKLSTVRRWVAQCVCRWEVEGKSFIELSQQERLALMAANLERSQSLTDNRPKSRKDNYLPAINPSGEIELMPRSEVWTTKRKYECLVAARQIASGV